jgi:hypothetical protein
MAFRMKHWLAATVTGMALIAVWRLPPDSHPVMDDVVPLAERVAYSRLFEELRLTGERLRSIAWADSLSALAVHTAVDGVAVAAFGDPEVLVGPVAAMHEAARAEIAALHARSSTVFGYVYQPHDHASLPGMHPPPTRRTETYAGALDGVPYCLQVRVIAAERVEEVIESKLRGEDRPNASPRSGLLGACRPYVAHGPPGPAIQRWMERGGAGFSVEDDARLASRLPDDWTVEGSGFLRSGRRTGFGANVLLASRLSVRFDQCLAGDPEACGDLIRDPAQGDPIQARDFEIMDTTPAVSLGRWHNYLTVALEGGFLTSDLEDEFGSEAFARFWTSNEGFDVAFERAFGMDAGAWLLEWIGRSMPIEPPGPGLSRSASSGAMIALALLLGMAYARNRERSVG